MVTGGQLDKCYWDVHSERWQANPNKQAQFTKNSFSFYMSWL